MSQPIATMHFMNNTACNHMTCAFACIEFTAIEKFNKNEKEITT